MKQPIFLLITLLFSFFACTPTKKKEIPLTIIKGKIIAPDYHRITAKGVDIEKIIERRKKIGLITNAIRSELEEPNLHAIADDDWNYHFLIEIEKPTEIRLKHLRKTIPFYVTPGDEIIIDLDLTKEGSPHIIKGNHAQTSQKMGEYHQLFQDSFALELRATLPYVIPREFKAQRAKITQRIKGFTEAFIEKNAKDDEILQRWVTHHSEYRLAMDYLKYAFKTKVFNRFSTALKDGFPTAYFDFWKEYPVNNSAAFICLNYQNYLQFYRRYLMGNLQATTPYQDCSNFPNCNIYELELGILNDSLKGATRDLIISQQIDYQLVINNQKFLKDGYSLYLNAIQDSLIQKEIQARKAYLFRDASFEIPNDVTIHQSKKTGEEILVQIANQHKGRPTFLYFWNTQDRIIWTYAQLNERGILWKSLDSLNMDLVLLAHHSTPNEWKEQIINLGLVQDQWLLNDEQYAYFDNFFWLARKDHHFYDKIRNHENFILTLDENGQLEVPKGISFMGLNMLVRSIKWELKKKKKVTFIHTE